MRLAIFNEFVPLNLLSMVETWFSFNIIMLKRFKLIKGGLQAMLISEKWMGYREDDMEKARYVKGLILDNIWWDKIDYILLLHWTYIRHGSDLWYGCTYPSSGLWHMGQYDWKSEDCNLYAWRKMWKWRLSLSWCSRQYPHWSLEQKKYSTSLFGSFFEPKVLHNIYIFLL